MLTIDDKIMQLYRTDGVHKNLRVHFPNGEMNDLTNENIVYETLTFKESICSQDNFKFGLCEAAEISFETVGIDNMIDMEIECFIEIDVISLNEWDPVNSKWINNYAGRYVSDVEIDRTGTEIEDNVFSIPLGVFKITSCPRSQNNMTHRQVQAYTKTFDTNDDMSPFYLWKISQLHKTKSEDGNNGIYKMYLPYALDTNVVRNDVADDYTAQSEPVPSTSGVFNLVTTVGKKKAKGFVAQDTTKFKIFSNPDIYIYTYQLVQHACTLYNSLKTEKQYTSGTKVNAIYTIGKRKSSYYSDFNSFDSFCDLVMSKAGASVSGKHGEAAALDYGFDVPVLKDFYDNYLFSFAIAYSTKVYYYTKVEDDGFAYDPYDVGLNSTGKIHVPRSLRLSRSISSTSAVTIIDCQNDTVDAKKSWVTITPYILSATSELQFMVLNIKSNLDTESSTYRYSFYNAFTFKDLMSGYLELHAMFGNQERNGTYTWFRLSRENPITYPTDNYKSFWWDEYDVDPIGYVLFTYKPESGDSQDITYQIEGQATQGTSIYDMTNNAVLSQLGEQSTKLTIIKQLIQSAFSNHLDPIYFTPVDFEAMAFPWLEDGDYIEVTTPDGAVIETFVLSRSISGIQSLTDSIVSSSGEIIAGEDYEEPVNDQTTPS